jgi:hypothetical protein
VVYSIAPVANATTYQWLVPVGAIIASGQGTTSITVNFGTKSGNIKVRAGNVCGYSKYQSKKVTKNCRETGLPALPEPVFSVYPNPSSGAFIVQTGLEQGAKALVTITDLSGRIFFSTEAQDRVILIGGASLRPGIYMLRIESGDMIKTVRMVRMQ